MPQSATRAARPVTPTEAATATRAAQGARDIRVEGPWASWRALGTYVDLRVGDPAVTGRAAQLAAAVLDEVDATCSRFRADSDLSLANRLAGQWVPISPVLAGAIRVALRAATDTDGLVDPCLGELLVAAGYDRSYTELLPGPGATDVPVPADPQAWRRVRVEGEQLFVPVGASLDLGATGKAYAADLVAVSLQERFECPVVVSVGGDVRAVGNGGPWPVGIATDLAALTTHGPYSRVQLSTGGLAVSSVTARRWVRGGRTWHHVFDPRTGRPARGPWRAVAAYGASAAEANTVTTAALVLGADAPAWLHSRGAAALLIGADGTVQRTPRWRAEVPEEAS